MLGLLLQCFLFTALFAENANAQKKNIREVYIHFSQMELTLFALLNEIEEKTEFSFVYPDDYVNKDQVIKIGKGEKSVSEALYYVSRETHLKFKQINHAIYIGKARHFRKNVADVPATLPQAVTVTGTITSQENGEPLPGVNILIKGTTVGTVSDINGKYILDVPDEETVLVFSFIGFVTEEIPVGGRSVIDIALITDIQSLQEVVVVGYGTQKKSVVTGAISSIKTEDLENQQIGRIEQALQGRTSGLTIASSSGAPGAESTVRIRGATSFNEGASNPLYVVDGVVVNTGGIDYLNPADIASIEVLKDAASAAIYGARSSAGVILVTTKKGKSGDLRVDYNGYYGTQAASQKIDLLNASQYAMLRNEQSVNGGGGIIFTDPGAYGEGTDWQSLIFNDDARIQNHQISLSGGNDRSTFYTSFGYFDQEGIVASEISHYKRYNIRLNSTHKIADWLTFGQTLGYSHIKNKGNVAGNTDFGGPLSGAIMLDPTTPVIVTDPAVAGSVPYSTQPVVRDEAGNPYGISEHVQQQVTNPLAYIKTEEGNYNWSDDIVGNVFLEAEPIKGLKLRSSLGSRLSYSGRENFTPIFYLNSNQQSTNTSFTRDKIRSLNWNLENTVSYSRVAGDHNFTILLGQGAYLYNNSSRLNTTYFNLPVDSFDEASMNYDVASDDIDAFGREGIHHTVNSLFSRLTYNYKEKYLFTGIIRRDGSSRFGANNKYGYFPSASVGWVVTQEDFWPMENTVNFMKLRASYGITGNDVLGDFRFVSTVGDGRNYIFGNNMYYIGYSPDAPANPDLKWEETSQLNFGLDAVLFKDWDVSVDWYKKKTTGILRPVTLPRYVGATGSPYGNVADMENRGVEVELGYDKQIGEVKFDVRGNVSYLENEVTYLGEGKEFLEEGAKIQNSSYLITRTALGHAINSFYGFKTQGIFQNQSEIDAYTGPGGDLIQPDAKPGDFRWADLNNDGKITEDDRTFIGDPTPDWSYGLTFNVTWRKFDLLVFGQGVAGNQIFQGLRRLDIPTANWQEEALGRWHGEGTSNSYPRLTTSDDNKNFANPSDFHLEDGDYFRIKTLQIGYTLPESLISQIGMSRARVYVSSNNLFTFTQYTGFDPEIGGSSYGIDRAIYPQSRSFLLGVNISF